MKKLITLAVLMILVAGCWDKKIDSSTDETLNSSIEAVKNSLSKEKKKEFQVAIQALVFSEIGNIYDTSATQDEMKQKIKDKLDGKTADEVIAQGNRIIAERKNKERTQALNKIEEIKTKITELEKKRSAAENAKDKLKKFNVVRSRFYFKKSTFGDYAVIEITVKNKTQHAVSMAYFQDVLASPGRSIPWVQDSFSHKIPGGLEPGEQATWEIYPYMSGEWRKAPKDRKDMVLTVTATRIDGADEKPIYNSEFSKWDKSKLEGLNKRLTKLNKAVAHVL